MVGVRVSKFWRFDEIQIWWKPRGRNTSQEFSVAKLQNGRNKIVLQSYSWENLCMVLFFTVMSSACWSMNFLSWLDSSVKARIFLAWFIENSGLQDASFLWSFSFCAWEACKSMKRRRRSFSSWSIFRRRIFHSASLR